MITILRVGHACFALPKSANIQAILKALGSALEVRDCYSTDAFRYRIRKEPIGRVEMVLVPEGQIGPARTDADDYDQPVCEPQPRRLLNAGN